MLPNSIGPVRKPAPLGHISLAVLALLIIASASPTSATGSQLSRTTQESSANRTASLGTMSDDLDTQDQPDATCPPDGQCFADVPSTNTFYAFVNRIFQ